VTRPQDAFRVAEGKLYHGMLSVTSSTEVTDLTDPGLIQKLQALWSYQMVDPTQDLFDDEDVSSIVRQYAERHEVRCPPPPVPAHRTCAPPSSGTACVCVCCVCPSAPAPPPRSCSSALARFRLGRRVCGCRLCVLQNASFLIPVGGLRLCRNLIKISRGRVLVVVGDKVCVSSCA
jgi:hypothetical protein